MKKQYKIIKHSFWGENGKIKKEYYSIKELILVISWLNWYRWRTIRKVEYIHGDVTWLPLTFYSCEEAEYHINNVLKPNRPANQWTVEVYKIIE